MKAMAPGAGSRNFARCPERNRRHGDNPHDIPISCYFDISAGIRGSDLGHAAALECFGRVFPMLSTAEGIRKVAWEGMLAAEAARESMADLLGCEPRNLFFGNSATRTLLPVLLSMGRECEYNLVADDCEFLAIWALIRADFSIMGETVTRQNFGGRPGNGHLRCFNDFALLPELKGSIGRHFLTGTQFMQQFMPEGETVEGLRQRSWFSLARNMDLEKRIKESNWRGDRLTLHYGSHYRRDDGTCGVDLKMLRFPDPLGNAISKAGEWMLIADASHTVGALSFKAPDTGDIVIMNSSKALGGEPTLGICYVNDRVLDIIERRLPQTPWPGRIAFQFSPQTRLGVKSPEEASDCVYWISLPELFSLHRMVEGLDMQRRGEALRGIGCYIRAAMAAVGRAFPEISACSMGENDLPNMASFSITPGCGMADGTGLYERLAPYAINHEAFFDHMISPDGVATGPIAANHGDNIGAERLRISWSEEHTLNDAIGLCRKVAAAAKGLLREYREGLPAALDAIEAVFKAGSSRGALEALRSTDDRSALIAVAAHHPQEIVWKAALDKVKCKMDSQDKMLLSPERQKYMSP